MTITEFILGIFLFFLLFFLFRYFAKFFIWIASILGVTRSESFKNWQYRRSLKNWK